MVSPAHWGKIDSSQRGVSPYAGVTGEQNGGCLGPAEVATCRDASCAVVLVLSADLCICMLCCCRAARSASTTTASAAPPAPAAGARGRHHELRMQAAMQRLCACGSGGRYIFFASHLTVRLLGWVCGTRWLTVGNLAHDYSQIFKGHTLAEKPVYNSWQWFESSRGLLRRCSKRVACNGSLCLNRHHDTILPVPN